MTEGVVFLLSGARSVRSFVPLLLLSWGVCMKGVDCCTPVIVQRLGGRSADDIIMIILNLYYKLEAAPITILGDQEYQATSNPSYPANPRPAA